MKKLLLDTAVTTLIVLSFFTLAIWAEGEEPVTVTRLPVAKQIELKPEQPKKESPASEKKHTPVKTNPVQESDGALQITGPASLQAGQMGIYHVTVEGVAKAFPENYGACVYCDTNNKTIVFSSPEKGIVTLVVAGVIDSKPVMDYMLIRNGMDSDSDIPDTPEDVPAPDIPDDTLEGVITSKISTCQFSDKKQELTALAQSFGYVVTSIDSGAIQNPVSAREYFRQLWRTSAARISATTANRLEKLVTTISEKIRNDSLTNLKEDFTIAQKTLNNQLEQK